MLSAYLSTVGQTFVQIGTATNNPLNLNSATTDGGPIHRRGTADYFSKYHYTLDAATLTAASLPNGALITRIEFYKGNNGGTVSPNINRYAMWFKNSTATAAPAAPAEFSQLIQGASLVYENHQQEIPATVGYIGFDLTQPFIYTGSALELATDWEMIFPSFTTAAFQWSLNNVSNSVLGQLGQAASDTLNLVRDRRPTIRLYYTLPAACTAPVAGTVVSSSSAPCPNSNFTLSLQGHSFAAGAVYQWQSSVDSLVWNDISGANNLNLSVNIAGNTLYFRCIVICGAASDTTAGLRMEAAQPLSGFYTVDSSLPTSGTNFNSLEEALERVNCLNTIAPVTLGLASGTYTGSFLINNPSFTINAGVTITSLNNNADSVILQAPDNGTVLTLYNTLGVVLQAVTFRRTALPASAADLLVVADGADFALIQQCKFIGVSGSNSALNRLMEVRSNAEVTVINNFFEEGYYGIYNVNTLGSDTLRRLNIGFNSFQNIYGSPIHIIGTNLGVKVLNNTFANTLSAVLGTGHVINMGATSGFEIANNTATGSVGQAGIALSNFTKVPNLSNLIYNNAFALNHSSATPRAILLTGNTAGGADYVEIYHNSFRMAVNSTSTTRNGVFHVIGAAGTIEEIIHQNNVYAVYSTNAGGTTPANFTAYFLPEPGLANNLMTSSHNTFFIPTFTSFGYISSPVTSFTTLADFQTATGLDTLSFLADPEYTSATDLTPLPSSPLTAAGTPISAVGLDLSNFVRSATAPSIGAYEVQLPNNDAALIEFVGLTRNQIPGAIVPVQVVVRNQGQDTLQSLTMSYQLDNGPVVTEQFAGSVLFLDTIQFTFTASLTLPTSGNPVLRVWSSQPNGSFDFNTNNDTLSIDFCLPLTAGTYTAGGPLSDFPSVDAMLDRIYCAGITGNVQIDFEFPNKLSSNRLELGFIPGANDSARLTLNGQNDTISITPNTNSKYLVLMNGTSYVTLKNFVLRGNDSEFGIGIIMQNNANHNIIRSNRIDLSAVTVIPTVNALNASGGIVFTGSFANNTTATLAEGNLIDSNVIIGGHNGIRINGFSGMEPFNNRIIGNQIMDFAANGVHLVTSFGTTVAGNEISRANRTTTTTFNGIHVEGTSWALQAYNNIIHSSHTSASSRATAASGIRLNGYNPVDSTFSARIYNNLIYELNSSAATQGIVLNNSNLAEISYNTIDMSSTLSATGLSRGISLEGTIGAVRVLNNNISQTRTTSGAKHAIAIVNLSSTVFSNRNNLYVPGATGSSGIALQGATNYATLGDWVTNGFDLNSVSTDPVFVNQALRDYTPQNNLLNGLASQISYVVTDLNGQLRDTIAPDAGAIEFTVAGCPGPTQVSGDSITANSIRLNWNSTQTSWNIEYGPVGFVQGSGTLLTGISTKPYVLSGLSVNTCYEVYVQDSCIGQLSSWVGPYSFCTPATNDLAMLQVLSPPADICPDSLTQVSVVVENRGLNAVTGFSIGATFSGITIAPLNATFAAVTVAPGAKDTLVLGNINTNPGGNLQITAFVQNTGDQNSTNDTLVVNRLVRTIASPVIVSSADSICEGGIVSLWNNPSSGASNIGWFDQAGTLLASADTLVLTNLTQTTMVSAKSLGVITGAVGPLNTGIGSANGFSVFTVGNNRINLTVNKPVRIRRMTVYPQQSGIVRLVVRDGNDAIVRVDSIFVNQFNTYDPVEVEVDIPLTPGQYSLSPTNNQSAGGMQFNSNGASFPYNFGTYASITGTNSSNAGNYYYFYNIIMEYGSCESPLVSKSIVVNPAPQAAFTVDSSNVPNFSFNASGSSNAATYLWDFGNGTTGAGATASVTYTQNGTYQVRLIVTNACGSDTLTRQVRVIGLSASNLNAGKLRMYPNPTSGTTQLEISTQLIGNFEVQIMDARGRVVYRKQFVKDSEAHLESLELERLSQGIYQIMVTNGNFVQQQKLVIQK